MIYEDQRHNCSSSYCQRAFSKIFWDWSWHLAQHNIIFFQFNLTEWPKITSFALNDWRCWWYLTGSSWTTLFIVNWTHPLYNLLLHLRYVIQKSAKRFESLHRHSPAIIFLLVCTQRKYCNTEMELGFSSFVLTYICSAFRSITVSLVDFNVNMIMLQLGWDIRNISTVIGPIFAKSLDNSL